MSQNRGKLGEPPEYHGKPQKVQGILRGALGSVYHNYMVGGPPKVLLGGSTRAQSWSYIGGLALVQIKLWVHLCLGLKV